jgi:hypothetical protein
MILFVLLLLLCLEFGAVFCTLVLAEIYLVEANSLRISLISKSKKESCIEAISLPHLLGYLVADVIANVRCDRVEGYA